MIDLLWLIPAIPFAGAVVLALAGARLSLGAVAATGVGSVGAAAAVALVVGTGFISSPPAGGGYTQTLWTWMAVGGFAPGISLYLDSLSLVMVLVVTIVGFLIHLYSAEFMAGEEGFSRFFAYMNLFVGSMLTLVLADNLLLLYLGWEGVGLCSYLLIGFWYRDGANGAAARKAFIVTRVGDAALAAGLFVIYTDLGTLHIQQAMQSASAQWPVGSGLAAAAAALLLAGAVGKSAQLPLQTWLPDAMAGPTPVSALIHAATMVTAGVYLIARTNVFFTLAPEVQSAVAVIGAATLLLAGFSALAQKDIKRVLAYSTMSQIGYMFLALGVGAWSAAIFHFMTHAFFKALLFLGAGAVILALNHEHDIFKMGGLRRYLPLVFWTFLIGAASLTALPLVTAGFYSKDLILWSAWSSGSGSPWLWLAGVAGALLTSLYTFRVVFLAFFGEPKAWVGKTPGLKMRIPLVVLAILTTLAGFLELPNPLGGVRLFSGFLGTSLPPLPSDGGDTAAETLLLITAETVQVAGVFAAYFLFLRHRGVLEGLLRRRVPGFFHRLWSSGWGVDFVYDRVLVRPFLRIARINRDDLVDLLYRGVAWYSRRLHGLLSATQTGKVRWYAAGIALGAAVTIGIAVLL